MISAKEINAIVSDTLRGQLKGFSVNQSKHIAVQKHDEKIHRIGWSVGNALNGFYYLHFWGGVRYTKIDDRYEALFGQAPGFQSLIYCHFAEVGNTTNHGQFKVSNIQDVHDALTEVIAHIKTELLPLFYSLKDENDFLNYLCDRERLPISSPTFPTPAIWSGIRASPPMKSLLCHLSFK